MTKRKNRKTGPMVQARFTVAATATGGFCVRDARRPDKDIGRFASRRDARIAAEHLTVATQGAK